MNSKDFRTLQEAYLSVYEPQQLDEGIRSAVKRLLGGKKKGGIKPSFNFIWNLQNH